MADHAPSALLNEPPFEPLAALSAESSRDRVHAGRGGPLAWLVFALALPFVLPAAVVAGHLFVPPSPLWDHLLDTVLWDYLTNTAVLALLVGIGVLVVGTGTAWLVTLCRFPGRGLFEWTLVLPLAVPAYVMAYAYTGFLNYSGPVQTTLREAFGWGPRDYWFPEIHSVGGAAAMLALVLYPYVYLLARTAFLKQSVCALEVSRTLGCNAWASFWRIALPMARPALVGGTALALMETLADFGTVQYFGVKTFTTGIYRAWFSFGDRIASAQLATALLGFVALLLLLERVSRGERRFHDTSSRYRQLPAYRLRGWRAAGAFLACLLPMLLGFLLPTGILLKMALENGDRTFGRHYFELVGNSVTLAGTAAALAVVLALALGYGSRLRPGLVTRLASRVAGLGYAVPGTVIAVGVLLPFTWFDRSLDAWARETLGVSTGLLLTGGILALVFAYLVRFLAVALNNVEAGLSKIRPSMDDAARSLGRGPLGTLREVHAPLLLSSLLTAALTVFVDVMKELPATLLMRPFNFDTLAVQANNFASDERLSQAATPSLTIVAVGLLPVVLLSRAIARSRPGHAEPVD